MKKIWNKLKSLRLVTKIFIFIDLVVVSCFLFVYGPNEFAKNFWITTAMETGSHRYFAYIFYSTNTVSKVMGANKLVEVKEQTNASDILIGSYEKKTTYESVYEKEVLEHDEDKFYKVIEFKYQDYDCTMVALYDPTRLEVTYAAGLPSGYDLLSRMVTKAGAIGGINGGGYSWGSYKPYGLIVHDGKVISAQGYGSYPSAALTYDGILLVGGLSANELTTKNVKEAVSMGPVLIVNGKASNANGLAGGGNPRTAIAQRQDGVILLLVVNGHKESWRSRGGIYYSDLITILQRYGAYNAINMDGGSSVSMYVDNKLYTKVNPNEAQTEGQDWIKSAWIFK